MTGYGGYYPQVVAQARKRRAAPGGGLLPETVTLIAAMTSPPDAARRALLNTTMLSLQGAGLLTKLLWLTVEAAHDAQAGRLNWINPATALTAVGSPIFTADRGYAGDSTSAELRAPAPSAITGFAQDAATVLLWMQAVGTGNMRLGQPVAAASVRVQISPRNAGGSLQSRLNDNTAASTVIASGVGLVGITRSGSAGYVQYKDGVQVATPVQTLAPLSADAISLFRNDTVFSPSSNVCALLAFGDGTFTGTDHANFRATMLAYMQAVGAV